MAATTVGTLPRVKTVALGVWTNRVASRVLPLLVGVILVLPLCMLLANSVNVALAGQAFRFGLGNWQQAFADQLSDGWARLRSRLRGCAAPLPDKPSSASHYRCWLQRYSW